jgi:hypothetical protein
VLARRLLALIGVLLMIAAVATALAPPPDKRAAAPGRTTGRTAAEPAAPSAGGRAVHAALGAGATGTAQVVRARVGDIVSLDVTPPAPGTVTVAGYDLVAAADPDTPAHFDFFADRPGRFAVELEGARAPLGKVVVSPRP